MDDALTVHRLHFAFTVTYHYLFPQLTMGLALLILILKTMALRTGNEHYNRAARFWAKIFGINFALGVVTGIPMEFQFGTNWAAFSKAAGGVIGQTLAMEGVFSFFLESSFLGLLLFGEKRLGPRGHWFAALMVFIGSWLSGYLIIATDAWMQHPVGYTLGPKGEILLTDFWALLLNPWALWQYAHNMNGAVLTGCFVMASVGAFYLLSHKHVEYGRTFVRIAVIVGVFSSVLQLFPTGDAQGRMVALHQPVTLAAMEGLFETKEGAPLAILGQPDVEKRRLDNPLVIPRLLSFLTYQRWKAEVKGLSEVPQELWPDNVPLVYYSYHVMVGLGTIFIAILVIAAWKLRRGTLYTSRWTLWTLLLSLPFPYIANTAGWMTAELGRQPWLIYGLMRTRDGVSPQVAAGNAWFTMLGFMGLYTVLSILFLFLVYREIEHGPEPDGGMHIRQPAASVRAA
ncbi:MAG: cytochrome ubiquinol oxidase subunit I [Acidobacteria bacterium]|nr:cytochrome ubiquinol oxidase subunit I [Acidobacteriota bacterium]MCL5287464.1 cytochrome ubiquinol oxidase subunit I [Acidobacteriota bacterium]